MKKLLVVRSSLTSKGFTLVELMISLVVGLVLFAGVMSIFVGMRATTAETSGYGELQENGRFALSVLTHDLLRQNFWGDFSGTLNRKVVHPNQPNNDCDGAGGANNATFPNNANDSPFVTLWGQTIGGDTDPLDCFPSSAIAGSDFLQLKRAIAAPLVNANTDDYFIITNSTLARVYSKGDANKAYKAITDANAAQTSAAFDLVESTLGETIIGGGRMWQYQHHVYYVSQVTISSNTVPVLMQGRLEGTAMNFSPIIDGIERIRFMYGIDVDQDFEVDTYLSADDMTDTLWNNAGGNKIIAVKIFVLARSVTEDMKYNNTNSYYLGGDGVDAKYTVNDNYRRLLFSSTVLLYNNVIGSY